MYIRRVNVFLLESHARLLQKSVLSGTPDRPLSTMTSEYVSNPAAVQGNVTSADVRNHFSTFFSTRIRKSLIVSLGNSLVDSYH